MEILFWKELKTLWEKEKMLVTSIFSFSYDVFKRHFPVDHKKSGLCGKGLSNYDKYHMACLNSYAIVISEMIHIIEPYCVKMQINISVKVFPCVGAG